MLSDFGHAIDLSKKITNYTQGDVVYCAPEFCEAAFFGNSNFDFKKADVYSLGVSCLQLMLSTKPIWLSHFLLIFCKAKKIKKDDRTINMIRAGGIKEILE